MVQDVIPISQHLWIFDFYFLVLFKWILAWFSWVLISMVAEIGPVFLTSDPCPYVYPKSRDISCVQIGSEFYRLIKLKQWIIKNYFVSFGRMTCLQYLRSLFFYIYICKAFLNSKGYNMHSGRSDLYRWGKATSEMNYFLCFIIFTKTEKYCIERYLFS